MYYSGARRTDCGWRTSLYVFMERRLCDLSSLAHSAAQQSQEKVCVCVFMNLCVCVPAENKKTEVGFYHLQESLSQ